MRIIITWHENTTRMRLALDANAKPMGAEVASCDNLGALSWRPAREARVTTDEILARALTKVALLALHGQYPHNAKLAVPEAPFVSDTVHEITIGTRKDGKWSGAGLLLEASVLPELLG